MSELILQRKRNCFCLDKTDQISFLVDAEEYYQAFYFAAQKAKHRIYIFGWDIDSQVELIRGNHLNGSLKAPTRLDKFLEFLVEQQNSLQIYIICWDFSLVFTFERDFFPLYKFQWKTDPRIQFRLDGYHPVGGSHHQKVVVIDESVAFLGGLDLCRRRWDTPHHRVEDQGRIDPRGIEYGPFHDIQIMFQGPLAKILAEEFKTRWKFLDKRAIPPIPLLASSEVQDIWPSSVGVHLKDVPFTALSRTKSKYKRQRKAREVERLYLDSIERAQRYIYVECQYLTADSIVWALIKKLAAEEEVEIILVISKIWSGFFEFSVLGALANKALRLLKTADRKRRLRIVTPVILDQSNGETKEIFIKVHSKLMIMDDYFLRIGSANLNNRSMSLDTEYDFSLEAKKNSQKTIPLRFWSGRRWRNMGRIIHPDELQEDAATKEVVRNFLLQLFSEHLGISLEEVREKLNKNFSLRDLIDHQNPDSTKKLVPINDFAPAWVDKTIPAQKFVDPDRPIVEIEDGSEKKVGLMDQTKGHYWFFGFLGLVLLVTFGWKFYGLEFLPVLQTIEDVLLPLKRTPLGPLWIILAFVGATLIAIPLNVLVFALSLVFPPKEAFFYSFLGSLLACCVTFFLGHFFSLNALRKLTGTSIYKFSERLSQKALLSVIFFRVVPVAPFLFINLAAGASHIRFKDYLLGSMIGLFPGILILTLMAKQVKVLIQDPNALNILIFFVLAGLVLLLTWVFKKVGWK